MRMVSKVVSDILFCSILLVSCGGVTPVPTVVTSIPTSIALTPTPDFTATPSPTATLPPSANDYRLRPWSADDDYYSNLMKEYGKNFYLGIESNRYRYNLIFQAENLLRNPSNNWRDVAWQIVADYPKGISFPGMRPGEDLTAFLLEDLLNTQNIKPDELIKTVNGKLPIPWGCGRNEIVDSSSKQGDFLFVKDLFGVDNDGWVFFVGSCPGVAVYALHNADNLYRVEKLRDWQALEIPAAGFVLLLDKVEDVNNNGIPEIVIDELFGASGTPPGRGETIEFYEWNASKASFDNDSIKMVEDVCVIYEPCENGWRVEKTNLQGLRPVVINEQYATMYQDIDGTASCGNYIIEHKYLWKNAKFIEQDQSVLPPTDKRVECQLSWALQALKRNPGKIDIAAEIISSQLTNWTKEMNDMWGPASKDYFAFRLGLAYDMTGYEKVALALIQDVADNPSDIDHHFFSQLASSYLDVRSKRGKVAACEEISLLQSESEDKNTYAIYVPINKLREIWGVGAAIWMYRVDPVCDGKRALELLAQQTPASQIGDIGNWFTKIGMEPISIKVINESKGLIIWTVSLPVQYLRFTGSGAAFERINSQQVWLFTKSPQLFRAVHVDGIDRIDISADFLPLDQDDALVVIPTGSADPQDFFIFHILSDGEIFTELSDYYVNGFVDQSSGEITTISQGYLDSQPEIAVYTWDRNLEKLDKKIINFDFVNPQDKAEGYIFQDRNFPQAILYINKLLVQSPLEPKSMSSCYYSSCDYYPEWYRPYLRYLLALSYEMSGQMDQARDAYYALWQDYPTNIFGFASGHRLNLAKP